MTPTCYHDVMRKVVLIAVTITVIVTVILYLRRRPERLQAQNVLLITIDTLRADHLGCYGFARAQTPNIDRWAERGALFLNASTAVPLTLPSHSTIMTGAYPFTHGVRDNGGFYLEEKWKTLAETLKDAGFHTGGFISAFVLDRRWGIGQGFDEYFDHFELSKYKMISLDSVQRKGEETLQQALSWIDRNKSSRFFVWIHFYDPHTPYDPPEPFRREWNKGGAFDLYDGEISYVDNLIGRIQSYLMQNNLLSSTAVILMSDHGESLGEHEETGHGFFIYDATMHIPLMILVPGEKGSRIEDQVRSIDIYPTICDIVGVKPPDSVKGTSLLPLVEGRKLLEPLAAYGESYYAKFHYGWSELKSLRTTEYKYIDAPERELYRVSQDPREMDNLYHMDRRRAAPFEVQLSKLLLAETVPAKGPQAIDSESLEKLQALGYIGSYVASSQTEGTEVAADPKTKIRLYNLTKLAQWNSAEGKTNEAMDFIQRVLAEDPRILEAHLVLGNLYMKQKDYDRARTSFQNALKLNPDYASAIFAMARSYQEQGESEAAKAGFERLTKIDPRDTKPYFELGDIAIAQKDFDRALIYFRKVIELDPQQASSHNRLGACYLDLKIYDKAVAEIQKAIELNPRVPNAHFNLALIHEANGDWSRAIEEYHKELSLYPEAYPAHFNLGRIYRSLRRPEEERRELETCIQQKPEFGVAYLYLAKNRMDSGGDLLQAKQLVEEGIKHQLDQGQMPLGYYLLADILNRLGRMQEAAAYAKKARKLEKQ